jgi:hypothetical protein
VLDLGPASGSGIDLEGRGFIATKPCLDDVVTRAKVEEVWMSVKVVRPPDVAPVQKQVGSARP